MYNKSIDLSDYSRKPAQQGDQLLSYFLDGSRRIFKADDIAYANDKNRSTIYPIIAGQIGVGCCRRVNRQMVPEKFKSEIVLAVPDIANADGKKGFLPALTTKINDRCKELSRAGLKVSAILEYKTDIEKSRNDKNKFEDKAIAKIQDRMVIRHVGSNPTVSVLFMAGIAVNSVTPAIFLLSIIKYEIEHRIIIPV